MHSKSLYKNQNGILKNVQVIHRKARKRKQRNKRDRGRDRK